jgi:hypothetical protein
LPDTDIVKSEGFLVPPLTFVVTVKNVCEPGRGLGGLGGLVEFMLEGRRILLLAACTLPTLTRDIAKMKTKITFTVTTLLDLKLKNSTLFMFANKYKTQPRIYTSHISTSALIDIRSRNCQILYR